ncbi:MAG TPA: hypothetical protein PKN86_15955, partial [Candidatus Obscuribacter sp.]|nr:hypothetical protein [Candidatus Obscuribacter sp.]
MNDLKTALQVAPQEIYPEVVLERRSQIVFWGGATVLGDKDLGASVALVNPPQKFSEAFWYNIPA